MIVIFPGPRFSALRDDQKDYVRHLMSSWRAISGAWYSRHRLNRAIRKALNNRP